MKKGTTIFTIILFISIKTFSQSINSDIALLKSTFQPDKKVDNNFEYLSTFKDANNEFQFLASLFFASYKILISSQDVDACVFSPSCSVYAIESIKKHGILGILDASDRLQRCHPGANGHYPIDPKTGKFYDPVR
jgi:putative component of membrane protein insertase Oxa1/YidC/SpoIIIJ protein YidD